MSSKKYIDSAWKEKLWGQIGEELKGHKIKNMVLEMTVVRFLYSRLPYSFHNADGDTKVVRNGGNV
jgi:hypothetical protein